MDKVLADLDEAAEALSIGKTRLYTEILNKGLLPTVRIGRRRLVPVSAVKELAEKLVKDSEASDVRVADV